MIDTPAKFRRKAESMFFRANPDAKGAEVEWVWPAENGLSYVARRPRLERTASGTMEWFGMMRVAAPGYRGTILHASGSDAHGFSVR